MDHNDNSSADRRNKSRFALRREMRYKLVDGGKVIGSGSGFTLDISSGGAAFTTKEQLKPGTAIEISVSWPALVNGNCAIRLVACGQVVRSTTGTAACNISKFEFRTQARAAAPLT
ncbi:MAG: PilZ domain-containing protein [Bryobacteraceae bacterium]